MADISYPQLVHNIKEKYIEATGESDNIKFGEIAQNIYDAITSGGNIGYTVKFKVEGNDYYEAQCLQGGIISEPPTPSVRGKNFSEWQLNGASITFPYTPNADVELTASLQTVRSEMEVYDAGTVLRTFNNRTDTKTNDGTAVCGQCTYYSYGTQYFIMLVSKTEAGATYSDTAGYRGSLTYNGETWYYRGNHSGGGVPISTNPAFYNFGEYTVTDASAFARKILDHYFYND